MLFRSGPIIGFFSVGIPLVGRFISTLVKWRALFLLVTRTDTLVTLRNVWATLTGGWTAAQAKAQSYLGTLHAINAAHAGLSAHRMGGVFPAGMAVGAGAARGMGPAFSPVVKGGAKRGITYHGTRRDGTPIFIDNKTGKFAKMTDPRVEKHFRDVLVATKKGRFAAGTMAGGLARAGTAVAGVGRGLMALMGGPWGLALTGISIALPYVIGAIKNRNQMEKANNEALRAQKESTDWNTRALGTLASKYDTQAEAEAAGKNLTLEQELRALNNSIHMWIDALATGDYKNLNLTITTQDGRTIKTLNFDKYNRDQNLALGTR